MIKTALLTLTRPMLLMLLFLAAADRASFGQAAPDLAEASLEELGSIKVFSASKHLQLIGDAPSAVTVITADDIQQHGYRTLADVLQSVRGFFVTNDRNYSSVGVRGFARPGDYNTRVLLLVDGHRLNDNIYDEAMLGTEFPVDLDLVQRIEVVRGPASSLYGSNALFAVVNVITKHGADLDGLELSSSAGSFNTYQGRISFGKKMKELEYMVSGTFYGSRGQGCLFFPEFNAPTTNFGIAEYDDDDQVGSAMATVSYKDFTVQAVYGTREKGIPTGSYGTLFNNSGTRSTDSHTYFDLRYDHTFANSLNLVARTFFDRYLYQGNYVYRSTEDPNALLVNRDVSDGKWWGMELQATKTIFNRHRVTLGSEYRNNIRQDQENFDVFPYSIYLDDDRTSFVGAFYLQDEFSISKSLSLNAGVRYDYYSAVDGSTSPRAALVYRPTTRTALKLIYGEAFRVPNVYESYYSAAPNLPNPALRPEKIRSTEFVWEQGITKQVWFSTSVFYNRIHGLLSQEPVGNDGLIFRNLTSVNSVGTEFEVKALFASGLEGSASYSFQQTKDSASDQLLSDSPRSLAKLTLSQPLWHRRLFASTDIQYRSRIQSLAGSTISPFTVVNVSFVAARIAHSVDLSAGVYNLMDRSYFDPPSAGGELQRVEQDGRTFRFKMTWHFGQR